MNYGIAFKKSAKMTLQENVIAITQTMEYHLIKISTAIAMNQWEDAQYHVTQMAAAINQLDNIKNSKQWEKVNGR